ncbi:MAG TPA: class I SAM-dependent methyltransferase, partial [Nitrospira sp.]|nr:class I SAM-dependent methyltransferase [Nitrospira sp.]
MKILKDTYEQADIHNEWISVYRRNPLQQSFNDRLMKILLARLALPDNALILDAGCGTGEHSIWLAQQGHRCIGIDISERTLAEARKNIARAGLEEKVAVRCESLESLSFPTETFDAVHCRGVLMHVPAFETALNNLCRVLKP